MTQMDPIRLRLSFQSASSVGKKSPDKEKNFQQKTKYVPAGARQRPEKEGKRGEF
jgi:hypothetical protein